MEIKRGSIWYVESSYAAVGSEQRPGRPAIVVSNDKNNQHSGTVEMVYLTTQPKHDLPTHVTIHSTNRVSIAICEQITTVAVERIGSYYGQATDEEMPRLTGQCSFLWASSMVMPQRKSRRPPPSRISIRGLQKPRLNARSFRSCTIRS